MNVFEAVKTNLTVRQVAEFYGMRPNRSGLIRCIFHDEKTPSMKVDKRYYCFGCHCTGDVIDFAAQLFRVEPVQAAIKLAEDFAISYEYARGSPKKKQPMVEPEKSTAVRPGKELVWFVRTYLAYLNKLKTWKKEFAPKTSEEEWHDKFEHALKEIPIVEYYLDILLFGNEEDKNSLMKEKREELEEIEQKYFS